MIPRETVDQVINTAKIEEVVGDYVTLRRRGGNYIGLCPFHDERTPSFNVNPARNIYKCFGCGKAGSAVRFVQEMDNCSFPEAIKKLAKKYNIEVVEEDLTEEQIQRQDDRDSMSVANEWAIKWFEEQLWDTQEGQAVGLSYFRSRGLRDETIRNFRLGYSPASSTAMAQAAHNKGFNEKYLLNDLDTGVGTGLLCKSGRDGRLFDRYHDRVMFPFLTTSGKVAGFAGRILKEQKDVGKYVNSPDSMLFNKSRELFGLYQAKQAISRTNMAYLVEGQMDVIAMHQAGINNTVCSGGTALTEGHVHQLHRVTENVTILYDGDKAGIKAAVRALDMFHNEKMRVRVMLFPDGDDPDSFSRKHSKEEFTEYINTHAEDFIYFLKRVRLDVCTDTTQRLECIHAIIRSIAVIHNVVEREYYARELSELINMNYNAIATTVNKEREDLVKMWARKREEEQRHAENMQGTNPEENTENAGNTPIAGWDMTEKQPKRDDHLTQHFYNITQMVVRHGNKKYCDNADGTFCPVGYFLINDLRNDSISSGNPVYEKIYDEYLAHFCDPNFASDTFFLNHSDEQISAVAADMISDQYFTTRNVDTTDYPKQALRLIYELKLTICDRRIKELTALLKTLPASSEEMRQTQEEQRNMLSCRTAIARELRRL